MKARPFGMDLSIPVVITTQVIGITAAALMPAHWGWWPPLAVIGVCLLLGALTFYRRSPTGWAAAAMRLRRRRRRPVTAPPAIDIPHGATVCGVRADDRQAVTMLEVTGKPYSPTSLRGASVSVTHNLLPLALLVEQFDQPGGLKLAGIDVVSTGMRVRRGSGYPELYRTLLADRPAAGQRNTRLIVRLDLAASHSGLTYRASVGAAAAAVSERIMNTLLQNNIRARVLGAAELDAAMAELGCDLCDIDDLPPPPSAEGSDDTTPDDDSHTGDDSDDEQRRAPQPPPGPEGPPRPTLRWKTVSTRPGYATSYYFSPADIRTENLNHMWTLRSDKVVLLVALRQHHDLRLGLRSGPIEVSAMVRCDDPQAPLQAPTLYLNPLPADQHDAILRTAPLPDPGLRLPSRALGDPDELAIPIGSSGILLGTTVHQDSMLMLALTDPSQPTRIVIDTDIQYAKAILMRAAAVGERIAIYTDYAPRWASLSDPYIAVIDENNATAADFAPTIIVNDRAAAAPAAGLASTVITYGHSDTDGPLPDLSFTQISSDTIRLAGAPSTTQRPSTTPFPTTDVRAATFRAEATWTTR